jgi:esterase/lipase superfamily enzyme
MSDYIICTQNIKKGKFCNEPGCATYLKVPVDAPVFTPAHKVNFKDFYTDIINEAKEDIIVFIHGYNNEDNDVLLRHRELRKGFEKTGFKGDFITFAWPSDNKTLLYLEDRHDAKVTAIELVNSCIKLLAKQQGKNCTINVHLIAHSTGAYIVHEAFIDAETTKATAEVNWNVSQILFISGDVSSDAMSTDRAEAVYRHCNRLTNYFNPYDSVLAISNVKRVGAKNRVGRIGVPPDSPEKAVDVNCGAYYNTNKDKIKVKVGAHSHSWYFYSDLWYRDAFETIKGELDRTVFPSREMDAAGVLALITK